MALGWLVSGAYHPAYRKKFNIKAAQISGTPTNIPLAKVIASDTGLATHARSDGHDIAITKANGMTELDYERVAWDEATGALEIWLKAPDPESGDDYFVYYGDADQAADRQNATGVWSEDFEAAWHLKEASGERADSTANGNDLTDNFTVLQDDGQVGKAATFVRAQTEWLSVADNAGLSPTDEITIALWYKQADDSGGTLISKRDNPNYSWELNDEAGLFRFRINDNANQVDSTTDPANGNWYHVVGTYDKDAGSNQIKMYVDGRHEASATYSTAISDNAVDVTIGRRSFGGAEYYAEGVIDEARISPVARSANWIATCFNNQDSPAPGGTFWSALGSEEKESRYPAVVFQCPAIV